MARRAGGDIDDVEQGGGRAIVHLSPRPRAAPESMLGVAGGLLGNRSLSEGLDYPPLRRFPHRFAVGMGGLGLTCPGWHSRAAGVCQSQAVSPASGTRTADADGTPDYPGGHQGGTRLTGWSPFLQESPSGPLTATPVPPHPQQQMHQNCFRSQNSKEGWERDPFTLSVTRLTFLLASFKSFTSFL